MPLPFYLEIVQAHDDESYHSTGLKEFVLVSLCYIEEKRRLEISRKVAWGDTLGPLLMV